jgi:hypothetical protein
MKHRNAQFTIECIECSVTGDLSFSAGCDDSNQSPSFCIPLLAPDANFSMLPFDFTQYWVGVALNNFQVHVELNISLTPSGPSNEIIIPLLGKDGLEFGLKVTHTLL